jgi:hypothetical protein
MEKIKENELEKGARAKLLLLSKSEITNIKGGRRKWPCPPSDGCPVQAK